MRKLLGYLPQEFGVYPKVKAVDCWTTWAAQGSRGPRVRKETVEALLHRTNLWDARNAPWGPSPAA